MKAGCEQQLEILNVLSNYRDLDERNESGVERAEDLERTPEWKLALTIEPEKYQSELRTHRLNILRI
jgi:hypothetical protein